MAANDHLSLFYQSIGEAPEPYLPFVAGLEQTDSTPRALFFGGAAFRLALTRRGWTCAGGGVDGKAAFALEGEGLADLKAQPDGSFTLIFMAMSAPPTAMALSALGREAQRVLQPGGLLLIEAMNADKRATAPDALLFLAEFCGFAQKRILYRRERADMVVDLSLPKALHACLEPAAAYALVARKAIVLEKDNPALAMLFEAATNEMAGRQIEAVRLFEGRIARLESRMQINQAEMLHRLDDAEWRLQKLKRHASMLRPITTPLVMLTDLASRGLDMLRGRKAASPPPDDSWPEKAEGPSAEPSVPRLPVATGALSTSGDDGAAPPMRLLILKLDHIGDLIMALPAMELLRRAWPKGHITLVCSPENVSLAKRCGLFDEIIGFRVFPAYSGDFDPTKTLPFATISDAVTGAYDIAVDLRHDADTRPYLAHVNARCRAGFGTQDKNFCALDLALPNVEDPEFNDEPMHNVDRLCLLAAMVAQRFGRSALASARALEAAGGLPPPFEPKTYVVLSPGAGTTIKQWPMHKLVALTRSIVGELGLNVVLVGGEREKPMGESLAAAAPAGRVLDLIGRLPLVELPALIAASCGYVGNDTGVTHMAALLDTATICVFGGANDSRIWRPVGPNVTLVTYPISCAPCHLIQLADCPHGHACMENIGVEEILAPLRRFARAAEALAVT